MRWTSMCVVVLMIASFQVHDLYAQNIKSQNSTAKTAKEDDKRESTKSDGAPKRSSDKDDVPKLKAVNIFIQPIGLVISKEEDVTIGVDVRVVRFVTVGFDCRYMTGSTSNAVTALPEGTFINGARLRAEAYFNGKAFTSSFVAQLNYSFYSLKRDSYSRLTSELGSLDVSGPGVMFGWKWFWTDPGEFGLNVGLMLGAYVLRGENSMQSFNSTLLDGRCELGFAF